MRASLPPAPKPGLLLVCPEQRLMELKETLAIVQKSMRSLRRQEEAGRRKQLEEDLEIATQAGHRAEQQRLIRLLARKSRGAGKKRLNALCTHKPTASEITNTAKMDAAEAGLLAVVVDWAEQLRSWREDKIYPDEPMALLPHRRNETVNAEENLKIVLASLTRTQKR